MSTNRLFSTLLVMVVLGTVTLTIRESAATSSVVQQVQAQEARLGQRSQDAETERWLAMASFYERQASEASLAGMQLRKPLTSYDAAESMAYRWQAMANYMKQHKPLTEYDAAESMAYRWQAMANYYLQDSLVRIR